MFEIIDDLKIKLDHHRPLPPAIVKNLHEYLLLRGFTIPMRLRVTL
jgi:hypothetical protein